MKVRHARRCSVLLASAALSFGAGAQDQDDFFALEGAPEEEQAQPAFDNYVEIGAGYLSDDSFRHGKYSGLTEEGFEPLLSFVLRKRPAWNSDDTTFWRVEGWRVGQESRRLEAEVGEQGTQRLRIGYRQTPRNLIDDARTPFRNLGSTFFTLPADWEVTGATTADMPRLEDSLQGVDIRHTRRRLEVAYQRQLPMNWTLEVDYRRETKEGNRTLGAVIGSSGGNPRTVILPAPMDFAYDIVDLSLQYAGDDYHVGFGYYGSFFENERDSLTWENPFGQFAGWAPGVGFPDGLGRMALEPDNQFNQVRGFGQYRFSPATSLTATVALGRMEQNDPFLDYTVNRNLLAPVPLPRTSLEGNIDTTLVDLKLVSQPFDRFSLVTGLRYDDRENETPRDVFLAVGGDAVNQEEPGLGRINLPYSYTKTTVDVDGTYRLTGRTRITAGYRYAETDRDFSEVLESDEQTVSLGLRTQPAHTLAVNAHVAHEQRDVAAYVGNRPFLLSHEPGAVDADDFENHPLLRKYYLADRDRDKAILRADWFPSAQWSFGLSSSYSEDDYDANTFGLNKAEVQAHSADLGYAPFDDMHFTAFYTHERFDADQSGRSWPGFAPQLAFDPNQNWFVRSEDTVDTVGLSGTFEDVGSRLGLARRSDGTGRLDLGFDYAYSRARSEIDVTGAANITTAPLPDLFTKLASYGMHGDYRATTATVFRIGIRYEKYDTRDFALDGIDVDTLANVLGLGNDSPDYSALWLTFAVRYEF